MSAESQRLAELSRAVRESTLKRLRRVPAGFESWRISPGAMSFADLAHHLVAADHWLFRKLAEPALAPMVGAAGEAGEVDRDGFLALIAELETTGEERARRLAALSARRLAERLPDARFGGPTTVWWIVVRGNLDHEAHHRGQLAAGLRALAERGG
jgi:uncharacterized damage-inducible protein DinB